MQHTNGGRLNHVTDGESLDGLVLGGTSGAVGATDGLDVATTLLVTSAIKTRESASRFIPIHIQSNPVQSNPIHPSVDIAVSKAVEGAVLGSSLLDHDCGSVGFPKMSFLVSTFFRISVPGGITHERFSRGKPCGELS